MICFRNKFIVHFFQITDYFEIFGVFDSHFNTSVSLQSKATSKEVSTDYSALTSCLKK